MHHEIEGLSVSPKCNRQVASSKWSRIVLRIFWATLFLKFRIKIAPRPPDPKSKSLQRNHQLALEFFQPQPPSANKYRFPRNIYENHTKETDLRPGGCGGLFFISCLAKVSPASPRNSYSSSLSSNCLGSFRESPKTRNFHGFSPGGRDHDSQNKYVLCIVGEPKRPKKTSRNKNK